MSDERELDVVGDGDLVDELGPDLRELEAAIEDHQEWLVQNDFADSAWLLWEYEDCRLAWAYYTSLLRAPEDDGGVKRGRAFLDWDHWRCFIRDIYREPPSEKGRRW